MSSLIKPKMQPPETDLSRDIEKLVRPELVIYKKRVFEVNSSRWTSSYKSHVDSDPSRDELNFNKRILYIPFPEYGLKKTMDLAMVICDLWKKALFDKKAKKMLVFSQFECDEDICFARQKAVVIRPYVAIHMFTPLPELVKLYRPAKNPYNWIFVRARSGYMVKFDLRKETFKIKLKSIYTAPLETLSTSPGSETTPSKQMCEKLWTLPM